MIVPAVATEPVVRVQRVRRIRPDMIISAVAITVKDEAKNVPVMVAVGAITAAGQITNTAIAVAAAVHVTVVAGKNMNARHTSVIAVVVIVPMFHIVLITVRNVFGNVNMMAVMTAMNIVQMAIMKNVMNVAVHVKIVIG